MGGRWRSRSTRVWLRVHVSPQSICFFFWRECVWLRVHVSPQSTCFFLLYIYVCVFMCLYIPCVCVHVSLHTMYITNALQRSSCSAPPAQRTHSIKDREHILSSTENTFYQVQRTHSINALEVARLVQRHHALFQRPDRRVLCGTWIVVESGRFRV